MFKKIKCRLQVVGALIPFAYGVKRFFLINFLVSFAVMSTTFVTPLFYRLFINKVILNRQFAMMPVVIAGYLGLFILGVGLSYLKNYNINRMVNRTLFRAKLKIWNGFYSMPFAEIENKSIGDMKMRLDDDTTQILAFAGVQTIDYMISYLTLIVSASILFFIDWRLWLFSVTAIPLTFWIDHIISKRERLLNATNRENNEKMSSWLHASVKGWREAKALNIQKSQTIHFVHYLHNFALYFGTWINYWVARVMIVPKIKDEFFMQFGLYFLGGFLMINGKIAIGDLLVFALYYNMLSGSVKTVSSTDAELQANMPFIDRLMEELGREARVDKAKLKLSKIDYIDFEHVSFKYPSCDNNVLTDFSLRIHRGERVAITGKSGSGKTTLLKLVTGMVTPTEGKILFSGIDMRETDLIEMHRHIGFVMQENILFNTTIRENLLYGKQNATDNELWEACQKAYIEEFVQTLPDGMDTVIGERGIKLSGGQRQRIVLARLLLRDVDIFIFDEATSALDQYSESIIHDAIRSIAEDKTIIVVAHRQSSIELCNRRVEL